MRKVVLAAVLSFGMASASTAAPAAVSDLPVLPMPASFKAGIGSFSFVGARIAASDPGERAAAERLRSLADRSGGPAFAFAPTVESDFTTTAASTVRRRTGSR